MPKNRRSGLLTAKAAKAIDNRAKDRLGIPVSVLMENAGRSIAEEAQKLLRKQGKVAVFCGRGNNGADGFVAARHLLASRIKPDIFLAGKISEVQGEARMNLNILIRLKQKVRQLNLKNLTSTGRKMRRYSLIIDALLGVGLKGKARGIFAELIPLINASGAYILSVDIPSGLDATTGKARGCCVKADKTLTFVAKKRGMVIASGPEYCGKVIVRGLGAPL